MGENPTNQATTRIVEGPSVGGESGVRVVPLRTMVAALPGPFSRLSSNSSGNSIGLYYPVLGRFPHPASGIARGERGSQASSARQSTGLQNEQHTTLESVVEQLNAEEAARDGNVIILEVYLILKL